jgi:hypothetical protein
LAGTPATKDDSSLKHDGARGHERTGSDDSAVQDGGAHADEAVVLHRASMHDGTVSDADALANGAGETGIGMQDHIVLEV